jgi:hypothetical protein
MSRIIPLFCVDFRSHDYIRLLLDSDDNKIMNKLCAITK